MVYPTSVSDELTRATWYGQNPCAEAPSENSSRPWQNSCVDPPFSAHGPQSYPKQCDMFRRMANLPLITCPTCECRSRRTPSPRDGTSSRPMTCLRRGRRSPTVEHASTRAGIPRFSCESDSRSAQAAVKTGRHRIMNTPNRPRTLGAARRFAHQWRYSVLDWREQPLISPGPIPPPRGSESPCLASAGRIHRSSA